MGPLAWSPHHDLIQYLHHMQFNTMGSKTGVLHSPPPLIALSLVLYKNWTKWMCQEDGILRLPCSLFTTVVLPLHLYISNGMIWNSSKSSLACISLHHMIFFWSWRILLLGLEHFQCHWKLEIPILRHPSNESITMLVFTRFSKIIA